MMAMSALRFVSFSNSRRIICRYRSSLTSHLRYLHDRLTPISINNCRLVPLRQRRFLHSPERVTSCYSFVRWNSSSSASTGVHNADVSLCLLLHVIGLCCSLQLKLSKMFVSWKRLVWESALQFWTFPYWKIQN